MQTQMHVPTLSKANKIIIIAYVGLFLLSQILLATMGTSLIPVLGLTTFGLKKGMIFQLVSYPFIDKSLMTVIFNSLIIWFIGSELEQKWGTRFYLKFLALATYSCGAIFIIAGLMSSSLFNIVPLFGMTGMNLALLVAYAIIYSERTMIFMFIFPMKAKYFCMLLVGIEIFMAFSSTAFNSAWAHLISMGSGFLFLKYQSLRAQGLGVKNIMDNHKSHQARKKRGNLRLVKTEDERPDPEDPKYWQ